MIPVDLKVMRHRKKEFELVLAGRQGIAVLMMWSITDWVGRVLLPGAHGRHLGFGLYALLHGDGVLPICGRHFSFHF